jgi:hypothetical protein
MAKFLDKIGMFKWFLENVLGQFELEEYSSLSKSTSGLPVELYLDETHAYTRWRHGKEIIFQGDHDHFTNWNKLFPMTISKDNPETPSKMLRKLKLPAEDVNAIKTFVRNNAALLEKLADEEIDFLDFIQQMKTNSGKEKQ